MGRTRSWLWLQLIIGWLPVWALYALLIVTAHPGNSLHTAAFAALQAIVLAALLGLAVQRLVARLPWPHPFGLRFAAIHVLGAILYSAAWIGMIAALETVVHPGAPAMVGSMPQGYFVLGVWFYVMVAGISYASTAAERAARAEALVAQSQLAALRAQLNPHFVFNALHTVVQLIPGDPALASRAAEQVAGLLRTTLEEDRDLVPLSDEVAFVEQYLEIERIRFGDRLDVRIHVTGDAAAATIPSFALQTLVENAIRHGAGPRVEPTTIAIDGRVEGEILTLTVRDNGGGASPEQLGRKGGTGLSRLRDRLAALYQGRARLDLSTAPGTGFTASLSVPQDTGE